jgi:acyl-CoA oxidase
MENTKEFINTSLNSVNPETRDKIFNLVKDPLFTPVYDISIRNEKELAQQRLKVISSAKAVSIRDFLTNPENIFTMHEIVLIIK